MSHYDPAFRAVTHTSEEVDQARELLDTAIRVRDAVLWTLHSRGYGTFQRLADATRDNNDEGGITAQSVRVAVKNAPNNCTGNDFEVAANLISEMEKPKGGISVGSTPEAPAEKSLPAQLEGNIPAK